MIKKYNTLNLISKEDLNVIKETAIERIKRKTVVINDFLSLLDESERQNCELIDLIKELENERQDALHEVELNKVYRNEGYKQYRKIKGILQKRRMAKDTLALWLPIKDFAKNNKKLKNELKSTMDSVNKIIKEQNTRVYTPRSDKESSIAGKHFETESVDISLDLKRIGTKRKGKKI